jgi:hypothetical protein
MSNARCATTGCPRSVVLAQPPAARSRWVRGTWTGGHSNCTSPCIATGFWDPRRWHRDRPQRPKVWVGLRRDVWGLLPSEAFLEMHRL